MPDIGWQPPSLRGGWFDRLGATFLYFREVLLSTRLASGFSYVEVLLCSVIISIILVSGLRLFGNLGRSQQVLLDQSSADFLALQMVEEIKQQFYEDPDGSIVFGREPEESAVDRSDFDDVDDYHDFSDYPPKRRNGAVLSQYDDFTRAVSVRYVTADDFTQTAVIDEGFKEVTITISRSGQILAQQIYVLADIFVGIR
jgi:MSHA pilin protein MshD